MNARPAVQFCRSCGAAVVWALTDRDKAMPMDAAPVSAGKFILVQTDSTVRVRSAAGWDEPGDRYVSHFSTCPQATSHRKPR